jgi:transcriptional regulator with GAF, ATPase, and Fis domain
VTASDSGARLRLLYDLGCAFAERIEIDELIPLVVDKCRQVLDAEGVAILLLDPAREELYFPYVADEDPEVTARLLRLRLPAGCGIAGGVVQSGQSVRVDHVGSDPRFYDGIDRNTGLRTRNMLCAPLNAHGERVGVIQVINRRAGLSFTDEDLNFLEGLAGSVAVAIENARLYSQVKASEERLRAQVGALRRDIARRDRFVDMIGTGPTMAEVFRLMESAAASPINVLIEGETGTGKELVARGIHEASPRAEGAFVAVNCAAVPETLLESQLFGHRRGAFTGATQDQRGLFEAATGGTILLDEIGEMPVAMQAKLLRVIQDGKVVPVGDTRPRRVDVRVISATNRDLSEEVRQRAFREDLYYRVAAFPIRMPPLRERREDIPLLAGRFLTAAAARHGKRVPGIEPAAMALLVQFEWPGNVRELQNEIERAVALACDGSMVSLAHLSPKLREAPSLPEPSVAGGPHGEAGEDPSDAPTCAPVGPLREARTEFEVRYIAEALRQNDRNVSRTARALGLSRVMLQRKMKEYGLRTK